MWSLLSDNFYDNPKVDAAGNAAAGVFAKALSYCGRHGTDGFIATAAAKKLGSAKELTAVTRSGLWQTVTTGQACPVTGRKDSGGRSRPDVVFVAPSDGYWIADYLAHNPTRDEHEELVAKRRSAANTRWRGHASASAFAMPDPDPVPDPVPEKSSPSKQQASVRAGLHDDEGRKEHQHNDRQAPPEAREYLEQLKRGDVLKDIPR